MAQIGGAGRTETIYYLFLTWFEFSKLLCFSVSYLAISVRCFDSQPGYCFTAVSRLRTLLYSNSSLVMQAEWWFEMSKSESEGGQSQASEASEILKERSRTLSEAAAVLSRASVLKNGQTSRNRHPDYEFFLSRSWFGSASSYSDLVRFQCMYVLLTLKLMLQPMTGSCLLSLA